MKDNTNMIYLTHFILYKNNLIKIKLLKANILSLNKSNSKFKHYHSGLIFSLLNGTSFLQTLTTHNLVLDCVSDPYKANHTKTTEK